MKTEDRSFRKLAALNRKLARSRWGTLLTEGHLSVLAELARQFQFSVAMGDLILLDGRWYVSRIRTYTFGTQQTVCGVSGFARSGLF